MRTPQSVGKTKSEVTPAAISLTAIVYYVAKQHLVERKDPSQSLLANRVECLVKIDIRIKPTNSVHIRNESTQNDDQTVRKQLSAEDYNILSSPPADWIDFELQCL